MTEKLKMHTKNRADENFKALISLFPNAVTETIDENGVVVRAIDKDVLMQEISVTVVEGRDERYQFTWPDKRKSVLLANSPISKTLRPCREESVDFDTTQNLYIEGDNLDVLKLLQETYLGKIKMIYIDPPYNTGHDFVYEDHFAQSADEYLANSGQFDDEGNRLVANTESNGRFHTDWLNMMYPRLRIARDLLTDDGVIFISIDDTEEANLIKICDDIFGESCFIANISWQRTYSMRNDSKGIGSEVEHILAYSKSPNWNPHKLERTAEMDAKYKNPDNDPKGAWRDIVASAPGAITHQGMVYAIQNPITGEYAYPPIGRCWALGQDLMLNAMNQWCKYELKNIHDESERAKICGVTADSVRKDVLAIVIKEPFEIVQKKVLDKYDSVIPLFFFSQKGNGALRRKAYLNEMRGRPVTNFWSFEDVGHTDESKKEIKQLFDGTSPFDTPKPTRLISQIIQISTNSDSLILDFFSGSATTADAIFKTNAQDGGNRQFILVQIPEETKTPQYKNLCEIGKERIRRAGTQIKNELRKKATGQTTLDGDSPVQNPDNLDIGFRVLKLDTTNMEEVFYTPEEYTKTHLAGTEDNIKKDRTQEDLLFQVMLELGVPLSGKITTEKIDECEVFSVEDNYLYACFDDNISDTVIKAIAEKKPYYAVFRDSGMANDAVLTNFDQIFAAISPTTKRKVL